MKFSHTERKNMVEFRFERAFGLTSCRMVSLVLAALFVLYVIGCDSDSREGDANADIPGASSDDRGDEIEGEWLIAQPDRVYSVEDFLAVGWKKSDQLDTETLTNAIDAWYGFYKQKDIELRFYNTHEAAIADGVGPAEETIKKDTGGRIGAHTVWTPNIALYGAYAVAGNVVMMCELELASCEALINALE